MRVASRSLARPSGAFPCRGLEVDGEVRNTERAFAEELADAAGNRPGHRVRCATELHESERVGERSEKAGVREHRATPLAELARLPVPVHFLSEQRPLEPKELRRGIEIEDGRGVEAVIRFGDRRPVEHPGGRVHEGRLPGGGSAFDGNQPTRMRHTDTARPTPPSTENHAAGGTASFSRPGPILGTVSVPPGSPPPRRRSPARVLEADSPSEIARELERTESDPEGVAIMTRKGRIYPVRLDGVSLKAAPLLKQETLSVGADSAHARGIADHSVASTSVVLLATWGQYQRLLPKLRRQPFHLTDAADAIDHALRAYVGHAARTIRGPHRSFVLGDRPRVMGVVNVTPDSFSDGGLHLEPGEAVAHAQRLVSEGAVVVDVGGESTRPNATPVSSEVEWGRVGPVISRLAGKLAVPISIDTRHAEVAAKAVDAGADLVNDVSGLRDPEMRRTVARSGAAAIAMHMRGDPATMQSDLHYDDLRGEVFTALANATDQAVADGIPADRLLIDPGLGFGKSPEQSLELLLHIGELRSLGYPIVVGASRKSFLGWVLGAPDPRDRLEAGLAAAVVAAERGVSLVRTHDVGPTVRALALVGAARGLPVGAKTVTPELDTREREDDPGSG